MVKQLHQFADIIGVFGKVDFQRVINFLSVCNGLLAKNLNAEDITATNGKVEITDPASLGFRVRDPLGISLGKQVGSKFLTDGFIADPVFAHLPRSFPIEANTSVFCRIDLVVLTVQIDNENMKPVINIKKGTPAAAAIASEADSYDGEIPLAKIVVHPNATTIIAADIIDCRKFLVPSCEQFESLSQMIIDNADLINQIQIDLADLQNQVINNFVLVQSQILNLTTVVSGLETDVAAIILRLDEIDLEILDLNGDILDIVNRLSPTGDIGAKILQNMLLIMQLQTDLQTLRDDAEGTDAALQTQIDNILIDLAALLVLFNSLQQDVVDNSNLITNNFNDLSASINALDIRIIALEASPGGIWTPTEKADIENCVADSKIRLTALEAGGGAGSESETCLNDLARVESGDFDAVPSQGARAFSLKEQSGTPVLSEDFTTDLGVINALVTNMQAAGGRMVPVSPTANAGAFSANSAIPVGDKVYRWRLYAVVPMADGGFNQAKFDIYLNPLGEIGPNQFGIGLWWNGPGVNRAQYQRKTLNFGSVANNLFTSSPSQNEFIHPGILPSDGPISYTDFELVIEGNKFKLFIEPEGHTKELAWDQTWSGSSPLYPIGAD